MRVPSGMARCNWNPKPCHDRALLRSDAELCAFAQTSFEEHLLVVALNNLVTAQGRAGAGVPRLRVDPKILRALQLLRDAYEHWDREQPAFARGVSPESGAVFKLRKLGPEARPWMVRPGEDGATLGGVISLSEMSAALDQLESELLAFEDHPD